MTPPRKWRAENPGNAAIRDEVAAAMLPLVPPAGELLDAGCGTGWWLARLLGAGVEAGRLHGLELDPARAAAASARAPGAAVVEGDLRALPYEDKRFTCVFLLTVLSSTADPRGCAAEAWRVLAPGGTLVVWEPRVPNPRNRDTRLVTPGLLREATGAEPVSRTLTLVPALARHLGPLTAAAYPRLTAIPALRTHRLTSLSRP